MSATLERARDALFKGLAENVLTFGKYTPKESKAKKTKAKSPKPEKIIAASNADYGNRASLEISNSVADSIIKIRKFKRKLPAQTLGDQFEKLVATYLKSTFLPLAHLRPGKWDVMHVAKRSDQAVANCEQYAHLEDLAKFCAAHKELAASLGNDYAISPDVIVTREPESDEVIDQMGPYLGAGLADRAPMRSKVNKRPILHACISCKFTLRSDRSQNARSEALNLIRNRKGRTPHIVIVTAECLPSRLASLALGTGDIDCLYHISLPYLIKAVKDSNHSDAQDMLDTMLKGRRIRDISDLPLDLVV